MRVMTCIKFVPDPAEPVDFSEDGTLDRAGSGVPSQLDEFAVEQSLRLAATMPDTETVAVTIGPEPAGSALRKALQMGVAEAVQLTDAALAGSDAFATAKALAAVARRLGDVSLIVCGMSSPDAEMGVVPALVAAELGWPLLSQAAAVAVGGEAATITRVDEVGVREATAPLPAVVSVTDQSGEPRYPSFKDVLAAKKKKIEQLTLDDLDLARDAVGAASARVEVMGVSRNPERAAGRSVVDTDGSSVTDLVAFLTSAK